MPDAEQPAPRRALGRDLPTPLHVVDTGVHRMLCLVGVRDGKPVYVPHGDEDDRCPK